MNELQPQQQQAQQSYLGSPQSSSSLSFQKPSKKKRQYESDLIVVLDMDECLIHSRFLNSPAEAAMYAHQLRSKASYDAVAASMVDSFKVALPDSQELVHVHVRPGLVQFLQDVTSRYETHIFTAAMPVYANPVLNHLCAAVRNHRAENDDGEDPTEAIFAGRWYREHCTYDPTTRAYVKDLSRLQAPLHKTVLVDNNPLSFLKNPDNGILVNSFYTDASDQTLPAVLDLLDELKSVPDVRPVLSQKFQLADALQQQQLPAHASLQATLSQQQVEAVA